MNLKPPALSPSSIEPKMGSSYPEPFRAHCEGRSRRALTDALGLTQFGVNITEIAPGAASSLRHWHTHEDEFVYVLSGNPTLITDEGEQVLKPGDVAGFPAGVKNGHHFINRTDEPAVILDVGSRNMLDEGRYSDVDLQVLPGRYENKVQYTRKNGEPYE